MRSFILIAVAGALALPAVAADAKAGAAAYAKTCKVCHGAKGEGNAAIAKTMKVELKHLGDGAVQAKSDADLKKEITAGVGKMKGIKTLSGADLDNVVAFVRTLKK